MSLRDSFDLDERLKAVYSSSGGRHSHKVIGLSLSVITVFVLAGCADSDDKAPQANRSNAASAGVSSAASADKVASVQQYAGVVNSSMKDIRKAWDTYQDEGCAIESSSIACKLTPMTLDTLAQTLVVKLQGAARPGVPAYIGKPPAEIEKLVTETMAAAQALDSSIDESGAVMAGMAGRASDLMHILDRWEPYI